MVKKSRKNEKEFPRDWWKEPHLVWKRGCKPDQNSIGQRGTPIVFI